MDRIDFKIIEQLQNNGRISNKSLAGKVHLAPSTCSERVKKLFDEKVIEGIHIDVDPKTFGVGLEAICLIGLSKHSREVVEKFQSDVAQMPEVRAIYLVSGQFDFMVHVAVKDAQHLKNLGLDSFTLRPEVTRIETVLIFDYIQKSIMPNYLEAN